MKIETIKRRIDVHKEVLKAEGAPTTNALDESCDRLKRDIKLEILAEISEALKTIANELVYQRKNVELIGSMLKTAKRTAEFVNKPTGKKGKK